MATTIEKACSKCNAPRPIGQQSWCKQCLSEYQRTYREANKAKLAQYRRDNAHKKAEYNKAYKPRKNAWIKHRRQTDPSFRIAYALRTRLHDGVVRKGRGSKGDSTMAMLGMDGDLARSWLEFQFEPGMSWDTYGTEWEIDHVLPVSRFDLTDPNQQRLAFGWTNIQPKRKELNRSKGAEIELHEFFNTMVSAHRFIQSRGLGRQEYQRLRESVAWLRATTSGMVTSSWMTDG